MKYSKTGFASYIPHLDTLRVFMRTLTRANIEVEYSEGFNPHMCLYFSNPIPLGLNTIAEYCAISTEFEAADFVKEFNKFCPQGLQCLKAKNLKKNPNFANILSVSEYKIEIEGLNNFSSLISGLKNKPFIISYNSKGQNKSKDFAPLIYSIIQTGDNLTCVFSSGAENLRHDIFISEILRLTSLTNVKEVLKTAQYFKENNQLINADILFEN